MTKGKQTKKRRIIWWRLAIVIIIPIIAIAAIVVGTIKIREIQAENREKLKVNLIVDGTQYDMNANQFLNYKTTGELPVVEVPEFVQTVSFTEEELNDLARQDFAGAHIEDEFIDLGEFRLTGYCNCEICCGVWSGGPCYNGEMPEAEWTIAVDPDIIPINSYVLINGHKYKACDTGSAIIGNRIDIYCNTHEECYGDFCNGYAHVYLIVED